MVINIKQILTNVYDFIHSINFSFGESSISLIAILQIIAYFLSILIITYYFNEILNKQILSRIIPEKGVRNIASNIISYSLGTLVLIIILQSTGFNLSVLAFIGGGLGIGIGLGLQDLTKNFVSGLTLLLERKIKISNFIKFEDFEGTVEEISIRTVILRLRDGSSVILPSNKLAENQIINYHYDTDVIRLSLLVGVAYGTDPVLVTETLLCAASQEFHVLKTPASQVLLNNFGDNALIFELRVWIQTEYVPIKYDILSSLHFLIEYNFRLNHITIAFPQRDLWIKNPENLTRYLAHESFPQTSEQLPIFQPSNTNPLSDQLNAPSEIKRPPSVRNILKSVSYFHSLNEIEIRQLIEIGQLQKLQAEEILFRENDQGNAFYIILSGSVEVFTEKLGKTLAVLETGSFFGELALMLGIPRTATVKAQQDTLLFVIKHYNFKKLLQSNPHFRNAICDDLMRHQEELAQRKQELSERGLLTEEEEASNIVTWVRKRLKLLFNF